jgi:hypothetical protein
MRVEILQNQFIADPIGRSVFPGEVIELPNEQAERLVDLDIAKKTTAKVRGPDEGFGNVGVLEGRRVPGSLEPAAFTGPTGIDGRNSAAMIGREDAAALG